MMGGDCPNGVMTVTKRGFTGGGVTCDLKRVRYEHPNMWTMNFKCSDDDKPVEERWIFVGEVLTVWFDLPDLWNGWEIK
jgi:hypothetical protein